MASKQFLQPALSEKERYKTILGYTLTADDFNPEAIESRLAETLLDEERGEGEQLALTAQDDAAPEYARQWAFPVLTETSMESRLTPSEQTTTQPANRYELQALLGEGAAGQVFSAHDVNFGRTVAVKTLQTGKRFEQRYIAKFLNEARILARLQHPNILPIYDLEATEDGVVYFTTPKVTGISLGQAIRRAQDGAVLPQIASHNDLITIMLQLCDAVAYAHSQHIIHQDIKPDNIMLGDYGEVLLVDWGTACYLDATGSQQSGLIGTPLFMSPEQARREQASVKSDLYCLGTTFFHMLTRRFSTWADDPQTFWEMKRQGIIDPPTPAEEESIPRQLLNIALKAMAADPADRYEDVRDFSAKLKEYQQGVAIRAYRDNLLDVVRRMDRANKSEGWIPIVECDFAKDATLDPRFSITWHAETVSFAATDRSQIEDGQLHLLAKPNWTNVRWEDEVTEETKLELVVANSVTEGPNLGIAVSGDLRDGYWLRVQGYDYVVFETTAFGYYRILDRCRVTLDPTAKDYHFTVWRSGNVFYAALNGKTFMEYHDPMAPRGPIHRTFAFGRHFYTGGADIRYVSAYRREEPLYVDILEPGRAMLREGHLESAHRWFVRIIGERTEPAVLQEARYLAALATPDSEQRCQALERLLDSQSNTFHKHAVRDLALLRLERKEYSLAVQAITTPAHEQPDDDIIRQLCERLVTALKKVRATQKDAVLAAIAQLPITQLELAECGLSNLAPLRGMNLSSLDLSDNFITDLSPLTGMPLTALNCENNRITDLSPLRGMSLATLNCSENRIADLSPLAEMPLHQLRMNANRITDLTPIQSLSLETLEFHYNRVSDLSPLRKMRLINIHFNNNAVSDISLLAGMPLYGISCYGNPITDLSPLAGMTIEQCNIGETQVTDLSPLQGLPVGSLGLRDLRVDLCPLKGAKLYELFIEGVALTPENLRALECMSVSGLYCDLTSEVINDTLTRMKTLETVNQFYLNHITFTLAASQRAYHAWRQSPTESNAEVVEEMKRHAVLNNGTAYLIIPISLVHADAEAFSRWLQGNLVCPSTEAEHFFLQRYIREVTEQGIGMGYHLGISYDSERQAITWADGQPSQWEHWASPGERRKFTRTGRAYIPKTYETGDHWQSQDNSEKRYLIVTWPEKSKTCGKACQNVEVPCTEQPGPAGDQR